MSINLQITDGLSTKGIQKTLIQTASEKIIQTSSYNNAEYKEIYPDWQYVAARLLYYDLYFWLVFILIVCVCLFML